MPAWGTRLASCAGTFPSEGAIGLELPPRSFSPGEGENLRMPYQAFNSVGWLAKWPACGLTRLIALIVRRGLSSMLGVRFGDVASWILEYIYDMSRDMFEVKLLKLCNGIS